MAVAISKEGVLGRDRWVQAPIRMRRRQEMPKSVLKGQWKQLKGQVREKWGELTDDEVDQVRGESKKLVGLLQEKYGYAKEKAEAQVAEFLEENT